MDEDLRAVGERVRSRMALGMSQRRLAERARMMPDALSRALNGQRGFSSSELARVADVLGADLYWLVTGREDPHRVVVAARHHWDWQHRRRINSGRYDDKPVLEQVAAAYREAYPGGPPPAETLPAEAHLVRERLGEDFVRDFADRAEDRLGIDVVRLPGLTTDYSLRIGGRGVILLATSPRWFRSNWSLAHEIGHLALGHHDGNARAPHNEQLTDRFAAALLLPADRMAAEDWAGTTGAELAVFLWSAGVSTKALRLRLQELRIATSPAVEAGLESSTPTLVRQYQQALQKSGGGLGIDALALREQQASGRRFPIGLVAALRERVGAGHVGPGVLAWALDVPVDEIDFPEPDVATLGERYEHRLGRNP